MKRLDKHFKLLQEIYDYFGYIEQWRVLPLDDARRYFWQVSDHSVKFADSEEELESGEGNCYSNEIYTQRHHSAHVLRGKEYTMIMVDTHCDGNQFLQIFENALERPDIPIEW